MEKSMEMLETITKDAGNLIRSFFSTYGFSSKTKRDKTIVTEADYAANRFIQSEISKHFPAEPILSEEGNTVFDSSNQNSWVVDPLDGTTNFSLGLHYWGVSIARLKNGLPVMAALYFPLLDEFFMAVEGSGAFLNGKKIRINTAILENRTPVLLCCSRSRKHFDINLQYKTRILGSAAYNLCAVASGRAFLAIEATPKIWDLSAAWLIITEAGGFVSMLDNSSPFPLHPGEDYSASSFPLLAGVSKEQIDYGQSMISPIMPPDEYK